jgi:glycyl-tRNA synthetase beta chain
MEGWRATYNEFMRERVLHLLERRGFDPQEALAVAEHWENPELAVQRVQAVAKYRGSSDFKAMAALFKRIKNITKDADGLASQTFEELKSKLKEPAELVLADEIATRSPAIQEALLKSRFDDVMKEIVSFREPVDRFFADVMVMTDDPVLRATRLAYLVRLRQQILLFADPSAIVQDEKQA